MTDAIDLKPLREKLLAHEPLVPAARRLARERDDTRRNRCSRWGCFAGLLGVAGLVVAFGFDREDLLFGSWLVIGNIALLGAAMALLGIAREPLKRELDVLDLDGVTTLTRAVEGDAFLTDLVARWLVAAGDEISVAELDLVQLYRKRLDREGERQRAHAGLVALRKLGESR